MHISSSRTRHVERHFTGSRMIHDIVIGMSDGLTVPFALAAGLSGAVGSTHVVITAGGAPSAAGAGPHGARGGPPRRGGGRRTFCGGDPPGPESHAIYRGERPRGDPNP